MKHLKAKLLATVMSLTLSMLMLTSASFAWFTISTAPEIGNVNTAVVTNENLEIALAKGTAVPALSAAGQSGNAYTWGNLVLLNSTSSSDGTSGNYKAFYEAGKGTDDAHGPNTVLRPITVATPPTDPEDPDAVEQRGAFKFPEYGRDGRITSLSNLNTETPFTVTGEGNTQVPTGFGTLKNGNDVYAYYIDFWVRSNVAGKLEFAGAEGLKLGDENSMVGHGTMITTTSDNPADIAMVQNLRIATRVLGKETDQTINTSLNAGKARVATSTFAAATTGTDAHPTQNVYSGFITNLTANEGKLIRLFIYLDGTNVTNAAASIDGHEVAETLTIQFKLVDNNGTTIVTSDKAMQAIPPAQQGGSQQGGGGQ